jgi:hypothetical protein
MERHHSVGVAAIVALMAAHRAASGGEGAAVAFCQEMIDWIDVYLHEDKPAVPATITTSPTARHRQAGASSGRRS